MGISLKPSDAVEGGVVPVDKFLTVKEARFNFFDYVNREGKTVATTVALRLKSVDDDGTEYTQQYSVGDPKEFSPSEDNKTPADEGKYLVPLGQRTAISKSSNFIIFTSQLVNAGFDESKLGEDISVLEGMEAFFTGIPEPKRSGLNRPVDPNARERVISVPKEMRKLPWEKKAVKGKTATAKGGTDAVKLALDFLGKQIAKAEDNAITRQDLAQAAFSELGKDPNRDAVSRAIFAPAFVKAATDAGYTFEDETFSKAG
jgi:hypothetical protein